MHEPEDSPEESPVARPTNLLLFSLSVRALSSLALSFSLSDILGSFLSFRLNGLAIMPLTLDLKVGLLETFVGSAIAVGIGVGTGMTVGMIVGVGIGVLVEVGTMVGVDVGVGGSEILTVA